LRDGEGRESSTLASEDRNLTSGRKGRREGDREERREGGREGDREERREDLIMSLRVCTTIFLRPWFSRTQRVLCWCISI
jgi:hypothetical protein